MNEDFSTNKNSPLTRERGFCVAWEVIDILQFICDLNRDFLGEGEEEESNVGCNKVRRES